MRVLVIDPDPARAALVAEGLSGVEPLEVRHSAIFNETEAALFKPDVVVVAADSPDRDTIESLREASLTNPKACVSCYLCEAACDKGAFGIPSFLVGEQLWFGKDRLPDVEEAMRV